MSAPAAELETPTEEPKLPGLEDERDELPNPKPPKAPRTPRKRAASSSGTRTRSRRKTVDIKAGMTDLYANVGLGVALIPGKPLEGSPLTTTQAVSATILESAEKCGEAWALVADENPAVKAQLERLLTASAWSAVIAAHLPILSAVALAVQPDLFGKIGALAKGVPPTSETSQP